MHCALAGTQIDLAAFRAGFDKLQENITQSRQTEEQLRQARD